LNGENGLDFLEAKANANAAGLWPQLTVSMTD